MRILATRAKWNTNWGPLYNYTVRKITQLWKDAIREMLEIISIPGIVHVDTGMSKASLLPVARAVRYYTKFKATIIPKRNRRKGVTFIDGTYDPDEYKTMALGEELGSEGFALVLGTKDNPVWTFWFEIQVFQYALHEPDWRSLELGLKTYKDYIRYYWKDYLPKLSRFIVRGSLE